MTAWHTAAAAHRLRAGRDALPVDVEDLCRGLGLDVLRLPLAGRLRELTCDDAIGISSHETDQRWVRYLIAHGLGHHTFDHGSLAFWHMLPTGSTILAQREHRADRFARVLLIPPVAWLRAAPHHTLHELANLFGVPPLAIREHQRDIFACNYDPRAWLSPAPCG